MGKKTGTEARRQEGLISQAQKSAKGETAARKSRPQIEAEFRKRIRGELTAAQKAKLAKKMEE